MKKWEIAALSLLCIFITVFGVLSVSGSGQDFSESENRALASKPELTLSSLISGKYMADFDAYYSDNFALRDFFVGMNKQLNNFYYYSGASDGNTLIIGFEGGAEMGGESLADVQAAANEPVISSAPEPEPSESTKQSENPSELPADEESDGKPVETEEPEPEPEPPELTPPDKSEATGTDSSIIIVGDNAMDIPYAVPSVISYYARIVSELAASLDGFSTVYSIVTPNSGEFYSPVDFHTGDRSQKDMIDSCYSQMSGVVTVGAYSVLRMHVDEYIYFRTDHHWTQLGAYYAYTAFCESSGLEAVDLSKFKTGRYERFVGSMYTYTSNYPQSQALLDNPDYLEYYQPIAETNARYYLTAEMTEAYYIDVVSEDIPDSYANKYLCFISGDTPLCVIDTDVDGPVCAVIKESYGNAFVPFLTSHYSRIYVIDPREFNTGGAALDLTNFAYEHGIDDIIIINYPFMINNAYYTGQIEYMIGQLPEAEAGE